MRDLLALARTLKLYYHFLHNIANGESFASDHCMMAAFYAELDGDFDSLSERHIGLTGDVSKATLLHTVKESSKVLESIPDSDDMKAHFQFALSLESTLRSDLERAMEGASEATENLLAAIADKSEMRVYKLKQRIR